MKKRSSKQILAEALLSLAGHTPLDRITVKQIVAESGLSLQTFYNHFSDKYDLIFWIYAEESARLESRLGQDGYTFNDLLRDYARFYYERRDFFRNALASIHGQDSYWLRSTENSCRILGEYIKRTHGLDALPEEVDVYTRMYVYATHAVLFDWASGLSGLSPEKLARYFAEGMPEGLKPYLLEQQ